MITFQKVSETVFFFLLLVAKQDRSCNDTIRFKMPSHNESLGGYSTYEN